MRTTRPSCPSAGRNPAPSSSAAFASSTSPCVSGRSEAEDLALGAERADAIVVTGDKTGEPTDLAKIRRFRATLGDGVPLLVGAGVTPANAAEQLALTDGAVVGSAFKDTRIDRGMVHGAHVCRADGDRAGACARPTPGRSR